jgi:hypothetical protein
MADVSVRFRVRVSEVDGMTPTHNSRHEGGMQSAFPPTNTGDTEIKNLFSYRRKFLGELHGFSIWQTIDSDATSGA